MVYKMKNNQYFINHLYFKLIYRFIITFIFALPFFYQISIAQEEYPHWIGYDIGNVWYVNSLASEEDTLWIGTYQYGLIKLNKITHEYQVYNLKELGFKDNQATSVVVAKNGKVWFLSTQGLVNFDGVKWTLYDSLGVFLYQNGYAIKQDNKGNLWVRGDENLAKYDGQNWEVYSIIDTNSIFYGLTEIAFDSTGNMWISCMDFNNYKFKIQEIENGKPIKSVADTISNYFNNNIMMSSTIIDIQIAKNGTVWFSLHDFFSGWEYLVRFYNDLSYDFTYDFYDDDFLPNGFCNRITIESENCVWIGGNEYLRWYKNDQSWKPYYFANGALDNEAGPIIIDHYGNKWVAIQSGDTTKFPAYIVALQEGGVKLSVAQKEGKEKDHNNYLYPIPAKDFISIPNTNCYGNDYIIYNLLGQEIQQGTINQERMDVRKLQRGIYYIVFFKEGKSQIQKFIKD